MNTVEFKVSGGGSFLVKETSAEQVFTPEDFSDEQRMMREAVLEFVDRELWPQKARFEQQDYAFTKAMVCKAGGLGLLGVAIPKKYGGLDMGFVSSLLVSDCISGTSGSFSTAFGVHTGIGTLPILLYGTEIQREKYLPKLASGEWFGAYCLTEPEAGSDANSGKTKAVLSEDGAYYKITGQKIWISNAGFADFFIVFARIEDDANISGFIVENDPANGVTLGDEESKLGIHSSSTRQIFFNETKIPVTNRLSERGSGFKIALNTLNVGRIKLAAGCLDAQRRTITQAVSHANERIQFNVPVSTFGAIQYKLAEMAANTYAGESACYRTAKAIEDTIALRKTAGGDPQEAELKGVEEYAIECSLLKVAVSEAMQYVADEGIQIYGGMGFSTHSPMESVWRDARITRIYEGTNEINRMLVVNLLLKRAMKGTIDLLNPASKAAEELLRFPSFETPDYTKLFNQEKTLIGNLKKAFLITAGAAVQKLGAQLEIHQQLLLAAADMMIEIYMAESTLLRVEKNAARFGEAAQEHHIALAKLRLYHAVEKVHAKGKEAIISFAEGDEQRMLLAGLKRFTKYANYPNVAALRSKIAQKLIAENRYCF